jgi:4'-phosphopantetheinyl transferase
MVSTVVSTVVTTAAEVLAAGPDLPLTADEHDRADAFHRRCDRDTFVAARLLTRTIVARHVGTGPLDVRLVQVCEQCGGPHGRPRVLGHDDVHVGWSHSGDLVAAVVDVVPCAIDIESLVSSRDRDLPPESLTDPERAWLDRQPDHHRAFAALWVRKEVLVKLGLTDLDEALAVDVIPSFDGLPVLGATLVAVDAGAHDAVAVRGWEDRAWS